MQQVASFPDKGKRRAPMHRTHTIGISQHYCRFPCNMTPIVEVSHTWAHVACPTLSGTVGDRESVGYLARHWAAASVPRLPQSLGLREAGKRTYWMSTLSDIRSNILCQASPPPSPKSDILVHFRVPKGVKPRKTPPGVANRHANCDQRPTSWDRGLPQLTHE